MSTYSLAVRLPALAEVLERSARETYSSAHFSHLDDVVGMRRDDEVPGVDGERLDHRQLAPLRFLLAGLGAARVLLGPPSHLLLQVLSRVAAAEREAKAKDEAEVDGTAASSNEGSEAEHEPAALVAVEARRSRSGAGAVACAIL